MSRLTPIPYAELSDERRSAFDKIADARGRRSGDEIGGPFDVWLRSPKLGQQLVGLGTTLRFDLSVDRRYIELVILVTGHFYQAQFEWYAHEPMARKAGVPDSVIAAIKSGSEPEFQDPSDAAAYQLAKNLHHSKTLSDAGYAEAKAAFGERGVAELVSLAGFYALVSMTLNAFDVGLPDGEALPFPKVPEAR